MSPDSKAILHLYLPTSLESVQSCVWCTLESKRVVNTNTEQEAERQEKDGRWGSGALRRAAASVVALMNSLLITFTAKWSRRGVEQSSLGQYLTRALGSSTLHPDKPFFSLVITIWVCQIHIPSSLPSLTSTFSIHLPALYFSLLLLSSDIFSPSPGSLLLYMFSIRQKGDRDGGLKGELGSRRKGFTPLIHRR